MYVLAKRRRRRKNKCNERSDVSESSISAIFSWVVLTMLQSFRDGLLLSFIAKKTFCMFSITFSCPIYDNSFKKMKNPQEWNCTSYLPLFLAFFFLFRHLAMTMWLSKVLKEVKTIGCYSSLMPCCLRRPVFWCWLPCIHQITCAGSGQSKKKDWISMAKSSDLVFLDFLFFIFAEWAWIWSRWAPRVP